jgi:hypothetical protein
MVNLPGPTLSVNTCSCRIRAGPTASEPVAATRFVWTSELAIEVSYLTKSCANSSNPSSASIDYDAVFVVTNTVIANHIYRTNCGSSKGREVSSNYDGDLKAIIRTDWA